MPLFDFLQFDPAWGFVGLGLFSFLSATILPGGSEALLLLFLAAQPEAPLLAVLVSTVGNTAGGMTSWWCGLVLPESKRLREGYLLRTLKRWGSPALLLSWLPLAGDALCVAAGWLRLHWLPCVLFMAVGKAIRYWAVVLLA